MEQSYKHICKGTCCRAITVFYDDQTNKIINVKFEGGCPGNTEGIRRLLIGQDLEETKTRLAGTTCREKTTSCPNEIAKAIEELFSCSSK